MLHITLTLNCLSTRLGTLGRMQTGDEKYEWLNGHHFLYFCHASIPVSRFYIFWPLVQNEQVLSINGVLFYCISNNIKLQIVCTSRQQPHPQASMP